MNKNDYKNYLDKIKCSPEFRERMENNLSEEIEAGYADSVSSLEHARRGNSFRWTAAAASVLFLLIAGGIALKIVTTPAPQHSTDISSEDEGEISGIAPRMLEDDTNANEAVMKLFEEHIEGQYASSVSYISGGGQFDGSIDFRDVDITELRSALEALEWTECEKENSVGKFYIVDGFSINELGYISNYGAGGYYMPVSGQDLSELEQALYNIRFSDPFNRLRNILEFDDLGSDTIEEEVHFQYAKDPEKYIFGEAITEPYDVYSGMGKFYCDRKNRIMYFDADEQFSEIAEFYKTERFWTFALKDVLGYNDSGLAEYGDTSYSTGYYGMSFSPADFDTLRDYLSYMANAAYFYGAEDSRYNYENIDSANYDIADYDGWITCNISIIYDNGNELTAHIRTDSENNIIDASIGYFTIYFDEDAYPVYDFMCLNEDEIKRDSEDFEIPEPSDELLEVHREYLREEGVLESEDVRYNINE